MNATVLAPFAPLRTLTAGAAAPLRTLTAGAAALLLTLTAGAAAQDVDLRITPRLGMVTPADWFYAEFAHLGAGDLEWTEAAIQRAAVIGASAELEIGHNSLWIRAEVLRTVDGETYVAHAVTHPPVGFQPPYTERTHYYIPSAITIGSLDLALPTRFQLPFGVQPYFTGGVGAKRYDFDTSPLDNADRSLIPPEEGVVWVGNAGGGFTIRLSGVNLDFLVRDAISTYWDGLQHDVLWMAGATWTLF
ncbi:MAG: hypothetical protein ACOCVZ_02695 [Gemmatimonadota bacterium]